LLPVVPAQYRVGLAAILRQVEPSTGQVAGDIEWLVVVDVQDTWRVRPQRGFNFLWIAGCPPPPASPP
jgi:hypothetical protein